jgi:hypothetical protein
MFIIVKCALRRDFNAAANRDIGNKRMNPASGLNVRALANSDVPTQSRLKAAIAIKMNSICDPHSTTSRISRNQNPITKIHMLSKRC